jgi:hypothetical protein
MSASEKTAERASDLGVAGWSSRMRQEDRMAQAKVTTDHETIRKWAEERGGRPAAVRSTQRGKDDVGIIRIEFPDAPNADDEKLEEITWDEFFKKFDEANLALVYQDETADGQKSYFYKIVSRETAEARAHGDHHASRH